MAEEMRYALELPQWFEPAVRYFLYAATSVMVVSLGGLVYHTAKHRKSVQAIQERGREGQLPKIVEKSDGR